MHVWEEVVLDQLPRWMKSCILDSTIQFCFTQEESSLYPLRGLDDVNQSTSMEGTAGSHFESGIEMWNDT